MRKLSSTRNWNKGYIRAGKSFQVHIAGRKLNEKSCEKSVEIKRAAHMMHTYIYIYIVQGRARASSLQKARAFRIYSTHTYSERTAILHSEVRPWARLQCQLDQRCCTRRNSRRLRLSLTCTYYIPICLSFGIELWIHIGSILAKKKNYLAVSGSSRLLYRNEYPEMIYARAQFAPKLRSYYGAWITRFFSTRNSRNWGVGLHNTIARDARENFIWSYILLYLLDYKPWISSSCVVVVMY